MLKAYGCSYGGVWKCTFCGNLNSGGRCCVEGSGRNIAGEATMRLAQDNVNNVRVLKRKKYGISD
jgi:hypothetical protein